MANETVVLTKNELVRTLYGLAKSHYQINGFGYGDLSQISVANIQSFQDDNDEFPKSSNADKCVLMWIAPIRRNLIGKELFTNFDILICDLVKKDGNINAQNLEVESDTDLICMDICSMLDNQFRERFYNTRNTTIDPFTERFDDDYTGSIMTMSLKTPFNYNLCQVPAIPINPDPVNPCQPATIRDSEGNLLYEVPSGNTQAIGDSEYIIKDQNGNIIDIGFILAQGSKEITIEIMGIFTDRIEPPTQTYQSDSLIGLSQDKVKAFSAGMELMTSTDASFNSTTGTLDFGYEPSDYIDIWAITN